MCDVQSRDNEGMNNLEALRRNELFVFPLSREKTQRSEKERQKEGKYKIIGIAHN